MLRHDKLLQCLNDSGIRGNLLKWCKNFLQDRQFRVRVGDVDSYPVSVTEGTAQGSVLGPLHYLTYVNSLANIIKQCEIYQFADDTCLVATGCDLTVTLKQLQTDFDTLAKWSHDVGLVLNASKTKLMYISTSHKRSTFKPKLIAHNHHCLHLKSTNDLAPCDCDAIDLVDKYSYLGLVIDDRLNWKNHIDHVCSRLRGILAKLALIKYKIPYKTLLLLYVSLGESIISYGLSSYGRSYKTHLDRIFTLQLRILKLIVPNKIKLTFQEDYRRLFAFCKIIPIYEKIELTLLLEHYFNIKCKQEVINYSNRSRRYDNPKHELPKYNNLYGKRKLNYIIPYLINHLPKSLKDKLTHKNIKMKLKKYYQQLTIDKYG